MPHAKTNVVTRPSLAALRLSTPVQYNAEDDGTTDLLFAIAAPENGSLHVDMLARMMQMLMNEDFVEKLKAARTPAEFLALIDAQEEAQFGEESFTQQAIPQSGYRILAVTACPNGIAHTYMAAEALAKADDVIVTGIFPAREKQEDFPEITAATIVDAAAGIKDAAAGEWIQPVEDMGLAARMMAMRAHHGDVIFTVGAGDITDMDQVLLTALEAHRESCE